MVRRQISNNNMSEEAKGVVDDDIESRDEGEASDRKKKGPWTPKEDSILIEYVRKHGEGNWNSVQKNSGLSRCGKSCRLRWANHLRPNLKKGAFSDEEEKIIIELHAKLGNKWAQMAAQLPGRTDNEIKNFWNTRMKKRQRAGLPLYPPQVQHEANAYYLLKKQHYFDQPLSSSPSFSLLLSSCYPKKLDEPTQFSSLNPLPNPPNNNNANLVLPLSPISPPYGSSSSSSSTLFNQSFATNSTIPLVLGSNNNEISSSQSSPPGSASTPASSYTSGGVDGLMGASSFVSEYYEVAPLSSPQGNSGLLDAVVVEAQGLSRNNGKSKSDEDSTFARDKVSHKRKSMALEEYANEEEDHTAMLLESITMKKNTGDTSIENQRVIGFNPPQLSTEKKVVAEDPLEEMNYMDDDDLFSLLNSFPSETPTPEWYRGGGSQSLGLETQANASTCPTDQEFAWSLGPSWNMGIC